MSGKPTRLLTIGSSCINRFQFEFFQTRNPGTALKFEKSFFDWNITSLEATETVLRLALDGELLTVLANPALFHVEWNRLIFNSALPGFCFYHEKEIAEHFDDPTQIEALLGKLKHQAAPFVAPHYEGHTHVVWSNIQPNLPDTVSGFMDWATFQLTRERHRAIKTLAQDLFGPDLSFSFLCTKDDVSPDIQEKPDVIVVDLPRGETFRGDPNLFESLLGHVLIPNNS